MIKHKLIAILLAISSFSVLAGPIENMANQCDSVMAQGVCKVVLDPKDYPNQTILIAGVGRINTQAYLRVRSQGIEKDEQGRFKMCEFIKIVCTENWDGDECKAVRSLWRQTP